MKDMVEGLNEMIEGINGIWGVAEKAINLAADRGQILGDINELIKSNIDCYYCDHDGVMCTSCDKIRERIKELSKLE